MTNTPESQLPGMPAAPQYRPPVVVDADLDDIEDPRYSSYKFRGKIGDEPVVFTLGMESDHLLANFTEWAKDNDVYDLYARLFENVAKSLTYEDGTDVDVVKFFTDEGEDVDQLRKNKLDDYQEWFPDSVAASEEDWLPELGPADVLAHWLYHETVSLKKLAHIARSALAQWSDELTDTSMRPQRLSRRERRSQRRR